MAQKTTFFLALLLGLFLYQPLFAAEDNIDSDATSIEFEDEFADEFTDPAPNTSDPLSGYNRVATTFNDNLYLYALIPVAKGWDYILPDPVQVSLNNFYQNLFSPMNSFNHLLQGKVTNSGSELARFGVNSTLGLGGLFDPAQSWMGLEEKEEDFGQTLGAWGLGSGTHIVLPILGPSNVRDSVGLVADYFVDPVFFIANPWAALGFKTLKLTNETSLQPKEYESLRKDALDLYPFLRDIYEQNRNEEIAK